VEVEGKPFTHMRVERRIWNSRSERIQTCNILLRKEVMRTGLSALTMLVRKSLHRILLPLLGRLLRAVRLLVLSSVPATIGTVSSSERSARSSSYFVYEVPF
jgi:hypothetical protein